MLPLEQLHDLIQRLEKGDVNEIREQEELGTIITELSQSLSRLSSSSSCLSLQCIILICQLDGYFKQLLVESNPSICQELVDMATASSTNDLIKSRCVKLLQMLCWQNYALLAKLHVLVPTLCSLLHSRDLEAKREALSSFVGFIIRSADVRAACLESFQQSLAEDLLESIAEKPENNYTTRSNGALAISFLCLSQNRSFSNVLLAARDGLELDLIRYFIEEQGSEEGYTFRGHAAMALNNLIDSSENYSLYRKIADSDPSIGAKLVRLLAHRQLGLRRHAISLIGALVSNVDGILDKLVMNEPLVPQLLAALVHDANDEFYLSATLASVDCCIQKSPELEKALFSENIAVFCRICDLAANPVFNVAVRSNAINLLSSVCECNASRAKLAMEHNPELFNQISMLLLGDDDTIACNAVYFLKTLVITLKCQISPNFVKNLIAVYHTSANEITKGNVVKAVRAFAEHAPGFNAMVRTIILTTNGQLQLQPQEHNELNEVLLEILDEENPLVKRGRDEEANDNDADAKRQK